MNIDKNNIKGIRIRTLNSAMLIISIILFLTVLYTTVQVSQEYHKNIITTDEYIDLEKNGALIYDGSDYLTEQVRLYTQTLDKEYADNYFNEIYTVRRRDRALESLSKDRIDSTLYTHLKNALEKSNILAEKEIYAIKLVAFATRQNLSDFPQIVRDTDLSMHDRRLDSKSLIEVARELVFNKAYQEEKRAIMDNISFFLNDIIQRTRQKQQNQTKALGEILSRQRALLIILCLLNLLTFSMIITLIVKPLQVYMRCIKEEKMFKIMGAYEFKHLAITYNDIYALKEENDKMLRYKADHDALTGLMNRSAFNSLKHMLNINKVPIAFLLIDVDKFKHINDKYGHEKGDAILCKVAHLLQKSFRAKDFCIRFGGDEFAVILKDSNLEMKEIIQKKIEFINQTLQNPNDELPPVSLSVGVAFSTAGFPDNLYGHADVALYNVKEHGRCGCDFYTQGNGSC